MPNFNTNALRDSLRDFSHKHFPNESIAFDFIWEAAWQVEGAKCIGDFRVGHGWSFQTDSIRAGGISGGAFSSELASVLTYYLYLAAIIEESGDMIEDINEFIQTDPRAPLLPTKVQKFLQNHGEEGLYALSMAIEGSADLDSSPFTKQSDNYSNWYKLTRPGSIEIVTGKLPQSQLSLYLSDTDFEVIIDEKERRIYQRRADHTLGDGQLVDDLTSHVIGTLWLILTRIDKKYIYDLDFTTVCARNPKGKSVSYTNFMERFAKWLGRDIAKTWLDEHRGGRIRIRSENIGFLWLQVSPDPEDSCLLSQAFRPQA